MGYACEFSPFEENKLAVSTAQHFGIIGNGKQYVLDVSPSGIREWRSFDTRDGVYDCTWSECNENHLVSASGDGSVKMYCSCCGFAILRLCPDFVASIVL
jgi:peroxin-7